VVALAASEAPRPPMGGGLTLSAWVVLGSLLAAGLSFFLALRARRSLE